MATSDAGGSRRLLALLPLLLAALTVAAIATPAYAAPGDLDPSFGNSGKVKTSFTPGWDSGFGVAIQKDGKILVAGQTDGDTFAVARYLSNGNLDSAFGNGGLRTVAGVGSGDAVYATAVALQGDGKILVAGQGDAGAVLVRLESNGTLDGGFGSGGIASAAFLEHGAGANSVAAQSNGRIVIAGYTYNQARKEYFAIARFTSSGHLDTSFSSNGMQSIGFASGDSWAGSVLIQPSDQKVVAIGTVENTAKGTAAIGILRLNTDGTLDPTFSGNGAGIYSDGSGFGEAGALTSGGSIIAAGWGVVNGNSDFALIEVGPLGNLNGNFGTGGKVLTDFGTDYDYGSAVALSSDGKIVVAGSTYPSKKHSYDFALARYQSNGALDKTFGTKGRVVTSFGADDSGNGVAIQSDGKIVVAGNTQKDSKHTAKFAIARYLA